MQEDKREPEIRFNGCSVEWGRQPLGNVYKINNERNNGQFPVEKTFSIATMTLNEKGNGADTESLLNYKVIRVGDVAYEGHTNKEYRYGRFVLNDSEDGIMSPRFSTLRPIMEQDYTFWKYYIHSEKVMRSKLAKATKAGTMMNELVFDDLIKQEILIPAIPEQIQIGAFLKEIDNFITLQQSKFTQLVNMKSTLLEKMFPHDGAKVPEIRFDGYIGDWEKKKLGELCTITSGFMGDSLLSNGKYHLTRIETISEGIVDEQRVGYTNVRPDDIFLLKKGDILYSNINSIGQMGKVAEYKGNDKLYHGINLLRLSPNEIIYPDFLLYFLSTSSKRKWADTHANQAVSQASINQTLLESQNMLVCSIQEQMKIGKFFCNLDSLISSQRGKIDYLQNIKQSFLDKMFVS